MRRIVVLLALYGFLALGPSASAQVVRVYYPPTVVAPPPVVSYSYYPAPVVASYPPPVTVYSPPVTAYYAAPVTTVYSPPVVSPGYYTQRTYVGYGIFRPRGVYTDTFYRPGAVVRPAYYYTPIVLP